MTTKVDPLPPVLDDNLEPQATAPAGPRPKRVNEDERTTSLPSASIVAGVIDPNADTRLEHLLEVIAEAVPDAESS